MGNGYLAVSLVRVTDDGNLGDRGMAVEHLLDDPRVDIHAVHDDQVLDAIDEVEVSVLIAVAKVAGAEPVAKEALGA